MDREKIKEDLSLCYLKAVAAINGIAMEQYLHDEDSTDVVIKKIIMLGEDMPYNSQIRVQLKSTSSHTQYKIEKNVITYRLKVKNYNDLCMPSAMPSILALFILPEKEEEWVNWSREELLLKGRMYWMGFQDHEISDNQQSISVRIPETNIINNVTIKELMERAAKEGRL